MQIVNCYLCRAIVIDKNYNLNSYSWFNIIQQVNKNYFEYLLNNLRCNLRHSEGLNTNVVGRKYSHVFAITLLFYSCNLFWGISRLKQKDKQNKKYILTSSTSILLSFFARWQFPYFEDRFENIVPSSVVLYCLIIRFSYWLGFNNSG